jgi:hypothetical protein
MYIKQTGNVFVVFSATDFSRMRNDVTLYIYWLPCLLLRIFNWALWPLLLCAPFSVDAFGCSVVSWLQTEEKAIISGASQGYSKIL